jgi:tetratricopeptide (TPR) repeat protein
MVNSGYAADVEESSAVPSINLNINAGLQGPVDIYGRLLYIPSIVYNASYSLISTGESIMTRKYSANQIYAGLGVKAQATAFGNCRFFAGADAGFTKISSATTDEFIPSLKTITTTGGSSGFSYSAIAGTQIYLGKNFYIQLDGGYSGGTGGLNAGIGLGYDTSAIDGQKETNRAGAARAGEYEKYGNYYYARRDYKKAISYYTAAAKKGISAQGACKAGTCYYALKDMKSALAWYVYSLRLKENPGVRGFVEKLKAAIAAGAAK